MSKLKLEDVKLLGQGAQIKKEILKRYKSIRDFYNSNDISVGYNTVRVYLYTDVIDSPTFKCTMTRIFDMDYNSLFLSKQEQITLHAQSIYDNIKEYDEEADQETFDYLLEKSKTENMVEEIAMMYRAKARNYYYTNWIDHCIEYYTYAIDALSWNQVNMKVYFLCELADVLTRENMMEKAETKYKYITNLVGLHKEKLDNNTLYCYHYWRGIHYMYTDVYSSARDFSEQAVTYADKNYEKAGAIANIGYAYKKLNRFAEASKYYQKALQYPDAARQRVEASVYNNIAMICKDTKDYENAIVYGRKALDITEVIDDLSMHIIAVSTYAEIQMEMGDREAYRIFFDLLLSIDNVKLFKPDVLKAIKEFADYLDDVSCLDKLIDIIIELREATNSIGYQAGLDGCISHIVRKIRKLEKGV